MKYIGVLAYAITAVMFPLICCFRMPQFIKGANHSKKKQQLINRHISKCMEGVSIFTLHIAAPATRPQTSCMTCAMYTTMHVITHGFEIASMGNSCCIWWGRVQLTFPHNALSCGWMWLVCPMDQPLFAINILYVNTMRPRQNGRRFANGIFHDFYLNKSV